jgi:hypothetical protein
MTVYAVRLRRIRYGSEIPTPDARQTHRQALQDILSLIDGECECTPRKLSAANEIAVCWYSFLEKDIGVSIYSSCRRQDS